MMPLAKLWTWTGHLFIPFAIGWVVYLRNGLGDKPPPDGVIIARAYWGIAITLVTGSVLTWVCALYMMRAKQHHDRILVPPNTTFEEARSRSTVIAWGTVSAFALSVVLALTVFGVRYGESVLHAWNARSPLEPGFWGSRSKAHALGCANQPCFAVGPRLDDGNNPIYGVNEYILYVTDGTLFVLALLLAAGIAFLIRVLRAKYPPGDSVRARAGTSGGATDQARRQ
jgi:hypothetical protein